MDRVHKKVQETKTIREKMSTTSLNAARPAPASVSPIKSQMITY